MDTKLTIPIAIVVAGALIAGALLLTREVGPSLAGTEETQSASVAMAEVSGEDHILGNPRAKMVIVEYSDTECPYCKRFHQTMHQVIDQYGREGTVAWVYRHFPIEQLHKKAQKEAEATECAAEQGGNDGFWNFIDKVYEITPSNDGLDPAELPKIAGELGLDVQKFNNCLSSSKYAEEVQADYEDAVKALGRGTPHSVLIARERFSDETLDLIRTAAQELPSRTLIIDKDEKKLVMTGALPFDLLKLIIDSVAKDS